MSPEVIRHHRFSIHVYAEHGGRHHLPHCHVRRHDGDAESVVSLPLLDLLAGPALAPHEWKQLLDSLQQIVDAWAGLNDAP